MQAVVFQNGVPVIAEVPEPTAGTGEVLVAVEFCGICGSDLHASAPGYLDGTIMGHEFAGRISALGAGVTGWSIGDKVAVNPNGVWCETCPRCLAGESNLCLNLASYSVGQAVPGGLARLVAVSARRLVKLPGDMTTKQGAWLEPLAVAVRAVNRATLRPTDIVLVLGAGPIGLLATAVLRARDAARIVVMEYSEARRHTASAMGAHRVIDPTQEDPDSVFREEGAPDVVIECTGAPGGFGAALRLIRPGGTVVVVGYSKKTPTFRTEDLLFKEIDVRGSFIYRNEWSEAVELLSRGSVDIEPLTSGVLPLEDALKAFDLMKTSSTALKYLLTVDRTDR